ncbi:MAG: hydrogenase 3 maturation endopeptidase HyCI [Anaerolineales bacterium]
MDATKTSKNSWNKPLRKFLNPSRKPAFVGIGQELRGDDAAGILLLRRLQAHPPAARSSAPFLFEAGSLPEASAGPLRRFGPDRVVFFDAADMGEAPGSVRWIDPAELKDASLATHTFPMGGFSQYLESEFGCRVAILGIQPECIDFDAPVSECVRRAMDEIVEAILSQLTKVVE